MEYHKQLFNLNPDKAKILQEVSGMSGLTKSQIMNDALAVHFGLSDPMVPSRLEIVRAAVRNIKTTTYPAIPPSGLIANEKSAPRKPAKR